MKTRYYFILKFSLLFWIFSASVALKAQEIKLVSGTVLNESTKKPFPADEEVWVYAFNTIAAAEDAQIKINQPGEQLIESDGKEPVEKDGYYEIRVASNGALIFKAGVNKSTLIKVNGKLNINLKIDGTLTLGEVVSIGIAKEITVIPENIEIFGDTIKGVIPVLIPQYLGKTNGRLIIQPFMVDCLTNDTVCYLYPQIYDGEQYHTTQERRMYYDIANDPLSKFVNRRPLTAENMNLKLAVSARLPNPNRNYHIDATMQMEDYTDIYYSRTMMVTTCRIKRPLRFLEYSLDQYQLDPNKYRVRARREKRDTGGNISLTFLVGKAELDPENPQNDIEINKLKEDLLGIINSEGTTLKEFHITGIASPEGNYQSNLALARRRVQYAQQNITSVLPARVLSRVYQNPQAQVAPWSDVADLLEADSLYTQAEEVRKIIAKNKTMDMQFAAISRLPFYSTTIKEYLPKLRTVKYEYKYEIFRELTPEEIYQRYTTDPDYKNGKKHFALYEYWHLFNMEKDSSKLETLYKQAYDESLKAGQKVQPWILPANNLASSYLKRDTFDLSILEPFINRTIKIPNYEDPLTHNLYNKEEIIANQLAMYLKAFKFGEASIMSQLLPDDEKNAKIKAFAMCLNGYYKGGATEEEQKRNLEIFNLVKESSPLNKVIMYLALNTPDGNTKAEEALEQLPQEAAIVWYLKAILKNRNGDLGIFEATTSLIECFKRDEKFIEILTVDGEFTEEIVEIVLEEYKLQKELSSF